MRANTSYSYSKATYDYLTFRDYYSEDGNVQIHQEHSSTSLVHRPTMSLEYKLNGDNKYLTNTIIGNVGIKDNKVPTLLDGVKFSQHENVKDFFIRNNFTSSWRTNKFRWNITSYTEYGATPWGYIEVVDKKNENNFLQSAKGYRFLTQETVTSSYEYKKSRIWMPLSVLYSNNHIKSALNTSLANNNAVSNNIQLWLAPQYEYTHPLRKYIVRASATLKWDYNHVINSGSSPVKASYSNFSISPYLYINWMVSPSSTVRTQLSYLNQFGDIGDFLTAPIRTDNLSISYKSGILSYQKSFNAMLHYDFKLPLEMWFVNADIIYQNLKSNIIANSNINGSSIEVSSIPYPHNSDNFTGMLNITKMLSPINTKISLGGAYTLGQSTVSQNRSIRLRYSKSYSILAKIISKPWSFIEFDYSGDLTRYYSKYDNSQNDLLSHSHKFNLNIFPVTGFQVKMGTDVFWKELTENHSKSISLVDFGLSYKFSHYRIGIDLNNILNSRHYSYTIFSDINPTIL